MNSKEINSFDLLPLMSPSWLWLADSLIV